MLEENLVCWRCGAALLDEPLPLARAAACVAKQLLHISQNLCWLSSTYITSNKNPLTEAEGKLTSKKDITTIVAKAYDFAVDALQNFDTKALADTVKFFAGPMNKLQIINLIQDHQTHHRAQLLVYLRLNTIKPPDYVGW